MTSTATPPAAATPAEAWEQYIEALDAALDALTGTEAATEAAATPPPNVLPPRHLVPRLRELHARLEAGLPAAEVEHDKIVDQVRRMSAARRPPSLQDRARHLGTIIDFTG